MHYPAEVAYQAVARRHTQSVVLVDGPAVLRTKSRHGILDADLFHDNVHPTLIGHVALAEAVLGGLKARAAFGWPVSTPRRSSTRNDVPTSSASMRLPGPPSATDPPRIMDNSRCFRPIPPSGSDGLTAMQRRHGGSVLAPGPKMLALPRSALGTRIFREPAHVLTQLSE